MEFKKEVKMKFGFNNDTADVMIVGALALVVVLLAVCIGSGLKPIERSEHRPEASVVYEAATQREVEQLSQEVERLQRELAKSQEAKAASCLGDNYEAVQIVFIIILALAFGVSMIWTINEMPPTVA